MAKNQPKIDRRAAILKTIVILVLVASVAAIAIMSRTDNQPKNQAATTGLAQCLTDSGAKMYGAYWCGHCQQQKRAFGDAVDLLPYVECANKDNPREQMPECEAAGITGYPTWVFADNSRMSGEISLEELAAKTGCPYQTDVAVAADVERIENQPVVVEEQSALPPIEMPAEPEYNF